MCACPGRSLPLPYPHTSLPPSPCPGCGPRCLHRRPMLLSRPASSAECLCTWLCSVLPLFWALSVVRSPGCVLSLYILNNSSLLSHATKSVCALLLPSQVRPQNATWPGPPPPPYSDSGAGVCGVLGGSVIQLLFTAAPEKQIYHGRDRTHSGAKNVHQPSPGPADPLYVG